MALPELRRKVDNTLICNYFDPEGYEERWKGIRPIHFTVAGNTIPGDAGVLEYYYDFALVFADDDPVNTLERYDTLMLDINRGNHFYFTNEDGETYSVLCISEWPETERTKFPTGTELTFRATFKIEGYIP